MNSGASSFTVRLPSGCGEAAKKPPAGPVPVPRRLVLPGPTARGRALLDYLTAAGRLDEAGKLREALTLDDAVMALLPVWCAGAGRPSERPWDHLGSLKFDA